MPLVTTGARALTHPTFTLGGHQLVYIGRISSDSVSSCSGRVRTVDPEDNLKEFKSRFERRVLRRNRRRIRIGTFALVIGFVLLGIVAVLFVTLLLLR
jgi:hypothetical protein